MKNQLLTIAAFTLLLAGQSASASNNSEEFLNWLNAGTDTVQVSQQPLQFDKVSIKHYNAGDTTYKAEDDVFSIHYMSAK